MSTSFSIKDTVARTLLIPLYMRAKETQRGEDAILKDSMAVKLVEQIGYDYTKLDSAKLSELGCIIRSWYYDNVVRKFIQSHKNPIVIMVGCGLDTRPQRLGDCGNTIFYELDLPEVITLRQQLIPSSETDRYIPASLLETNWMDDLLKAHPNGDFIFTVEGVLMYFYENQVKDFIHQLTLRFAGAELWFDVCGSLMLKLHTKPDSLKENEAEVRFGLSNPHIPEQWEPHLQLLDQASYMSYFKNRWGFFFGHILCHFPSLCIGFSSLLGYKIKSVE